MNVLYTCDNNYIWIMGISAISLFENNKNLNDLKIYLLGEKISNENKRALRNIGDKYKREIIVIDVPALDIPESIVSARWPLSAFTRLFSGQLLPEDLKRIIYLDCDTIVKGSLDPLNTVDINGKIFLGIKDCIGRFYKQNIGLDSNDAYINAGVLLINLEELRKVNINNAIDQYMKKYMKFINYADQDILNGVFCKEIGVLSPEYDVMTIAVVHSYNEIISLRNPTNYYTEEEMKAALRNPIIIHYTTNMKVIRPWFSNTDHPLSNEFTYYMDKSPWKEKKQMPMYFDSKESKIIDLIQLFPKCISYGILGHIHSSIRPLMIRFKACKSFNINKLK